MMLFNETSHGTTISGNRVCKTGCTCHVDDKDHDITSLVKNFYIELLQVIVKFIFSNSKTFFGYF